MDAAAALARAVARTFSDDSLAGTVEAFHRTSGVDGAIAVARKRSGSEFDPALVKLFSEEAATLLGDLSSASSWDRVIAEEPALGLVREGA